MHGATTKKVVLTGCKKSICLNISLLYDTASCVFLPLKLKTVLVFYILSFVSTCAIVPVNGPALVCACDDIQNYSLCLSN